MKFGAAAAVWWLLYRFTPPTAFRFCPFYWLTGLDCPLCGITRGLFALAKGHWQDAIHWNALAPLGALMLLALLWRGKWTGRVWTLGVAAFAFYGLIRNAL